MIVVICKHYHNWIGFSSYTQRRQSAQNFCPRDRRYSPSVGLSSGYGRWILMINNYVSWLTKRGTARPYSSPPTLSFKHFHILSNFLAILAHGDFNHTEYLGWSSATCGSAGPSKVHHLLCTEQTNRGQHESALRRGADPKTVIQWVCGSDFYLGGSAWAPAQPCVEPEWNRCFPKSCLNIQVPRKPTW